MFIKALETSEYIYFINPEECDHNGNVKMYDRKMNLLSDNIHASDSLFEDMEQILSCNSKRKIEIRYLNMDIAENFKELLFMI